MKTTPKAIALDVRALHGDFGTVYLDGVCETCSGSGIVGSELWAAWLRRYEHEERRLENERPALDRGLIVDRATSYAGPEPAESEELECGDCEGRGTVPTDVGLIILDFVRRYS